MTDAEVTIRVATIGQPQLEEAATFLLRYAGTPEHAMELLAYGLIPTPCVCGEGGCEGWAMSRGLREILDALAERGGTS